jgi:hypothetical protein
VRTDDVTQDEPLGESVREHKIRPKLVALAPGFGVTLTVFPAGFAAEPALLPLPGDKN